MYPTRVEYGQILVDNSRLAWFRRGAYGNSGEYPRVWTIEDHPAWPMWKRWRWTGIFPQLSFSRCREVLACTTEVWIGIQSATLRERVILAATFLSPLRRTRIFFLVW